VFELHLKIAVKELLENWCFSHFTIKVLNRQNSKWIHYTTFLCRCCKIWERATSQPDCTYLPPCFIYSY